MKIYTTEMFGAFLRGFPENILAVYRGSNALWHFFAAALTYLLVISGIDWWFFEVTRSDAAYPLIMFAGIGGFYLPVVVPIAVYLIGEWRKSAVVMLAASAMAQAVIIAELVAAVYKTFTGRMQPEFLSNSGVDISHQFQFGFYENGIFYGWPSAHTAAAFALAAALYVAAPHNSLYRYAGILYALLIALGAGIGFHWLSDVLAGAIIGSLVGVVVGRRFAQGSK